MSFDYNTMKRGRMRDGTGKFRCAVKNKKLFHQTMKELFVVGVTGFEPTASWSRTKRATNCATPRKKIRSNLAAAVVGDERIELPQTESESVALPLCKSPLHVRQEALLPRCPQRLVIIADWQTFVNMFFEVFFSNSRIDGTTNRKRETNQQMTKYVRFWAAALPQSRRSVKLYTAVHGGKRGNSTTAKQAPGRALNPKNRGAAEHYV